MNVHAGQLHRSSFSSGGGFGGGTPSSHAPHTKASGLFSRVQMEQIQVLPPDFHLDSSRVAVMAALDEDMVVLDDDDDDDARSVCCFLLLKISIVADEADSVRCRHTGGDGDEERRRFEE